jgi:hypothetical protein
MLATELHRLAQTVEDLGGLAERRRLLEHGPCPLPVRSAERLAAEA